MVLVIKTGELAERSRQKASGLIAKNSDQLLHPIVKGELAERLLHRSCPEGVPSGKTGVRGEMYFVYILKSQRDGGFYYGSTAGTGKRLHQHNAGKVRSTKSRRPFELHYVESYETKREAIRRERYFKSIAGYQWLKNCGII